jgi:ABC-type lipoprotein export system ATPase subunit
MSLELKNLSKKYTKDYIFQDFSYKFDDTGIYLILGKSGVGKTTLLRIISGLEKSFEGEALGGGIETVSLAFQEYRLFEQLSALENVHLERSEDADRAKALLLALGFTEDDCLKNGSELSGGMKQRVSIARAFFKSSPILCLDEPTKEIGKDNIQRLLSLVQNEAARRLILIITHEEEEFAEINYKKIVL